MSSSGVPKGGMGGGGPDPPLFKSWSSRFARKCNNISGGGGSGRSVKKWSLRFMKSKQRIVFQGLVARFWFRRNARTLLEKAF